MIDFKEERHDELRNFSSGPIQNEFLTINSEHPYYEDHFERKSQDKIPPSNQRFEQPEEELTHLKKSDPNNILNDINKHHS